MKVFEMRCQLPYHRKSIYGKREKSIKQTMVRKSNLLLQNSVKESAKVMSKQGWK